MSGNSFQVLVGIDMVLHLMRAAYSAGINSTEELCESAVQGILAKTMVDSGGHLESRTDCALDDFEEVAPDGPIDIIDG